MPYSDIPLLKVYSNKIVKFFPNESYKKSDETIEKIKKNLEKEKFQGTISVNTQRFIRQKLDIFLNTLITAYYNHIVCENNKKRLPVFITLTLSENQKHDDQTIKKTLLDQFLSEIKRKYNIKYLFWRAEAQKNGNIHFHVIVDSFINFNDIRTIWNRIQKTQGYMSEFKKKFGHEDAPSTHVKCVTNIKNFSEYIIKYATKEEGNRPIKGKVWGMSNELRNISTLTIDLDREIWDEIEVMQKSDKVKAYNKEHGSIYFIRESIIGNIDMKHTSELLKNYYIDMFVKLYNSNAEIKELESDTDEIAYFIDCAFDELIKEEEKNKNHGQTDLFSAFGLDSPAQRQSSYHRF